MTFPVSPTRGAVAATHTRDNPLENVMLHSGASLLFVICDEDAAYLAGYYADIRGLPTSENMKIDKNEIRLRIQVPKELRGNPDTLTYSHRKEDRF